MRIIYSSRNGILVSRLSGSAPHLSAALRTALPGGGAYTFPCRDRTLSLSGRNTIIRGHLQTMSE